jgi:hypothetical protein
VLEAVNTAVILKLFRSLVRPHLKYCIQAWRPHLRRDVDQIEKNLKEGYKTDSFSER